jgi:proteic killer suppression protein
LKLLDEAARVDDLLSPAGNRLEALKGDQAGRHSIRVNDQYRVTFRWENGNAYEVRVEDYHWGCRPLFMTIGELRAPRFAALLKRVNLTR